MQKNNQKTTRKLKILSYPKDNNGVYITFSCDSNYEAHLWVAISSIINNSNINQNYYIYILDGGIRFKENFYKFMAGNKNLHIEFIDMSSQFLSSFESRHVKKAAYYRLAVFSLFKNFKKLIYIDADSYVLSDIAELFNIDLENKQIAGVRDSITYEIPWRQKEISYKNYTGKALGYFENYLKLSARKLENYFSSGVLVFNLQKTDLNKKQKGLISLLKTDYFCHDQDILNLLFNENETYLLGREWNYFNSGPLLKERDFFVEEEKKNYFDNLVKPKIVSYVLKPWVQENIDSPYANLYWDMIKSSPYYFEIKENVKKNTKFKRFLKLSLQEKIHFLTSKEAFKKYKKIIKLEK